MPSPRLVAIGCALGVWLSAPAVAQQPLRTALVATGFNLPIAVAPDPTNANVLFVAQQDGHIRTVVNGVTQPADFLNLSGVVSPGGERGLLGFAFAPDYATSRRLFVNFTDASGHTVIARFLRSAGDPLAADASSRFDLRWPDGNRFITQPFTNHNGGDLQFGPDGKLYIGMGDGGSGDDPFNLAQDPQSLLGKMLRVDVSVGDGDTEGYDVPADNPFVGNPSVLGEIWSFGLRNPWRFSFDSPSAGGTGAMLIGDVGQGQWEEVDYEPAGRGGRNYGWRVREGAHDHVTSLPPFSTPLTDPIFEYAHPIGRAITGGVVYRGAMLGSAYAGRYFFSDSIDNRVWSVALSVDPSTGEATASNLIEHTQELGTNGSRFIVSFAMDANHEVLLVSILGSIYRLQPDANAVDLDGDHAGDALIYNVNTGGWARETSVPSGGFAGVNGAWSPGWSVTPARFDADARSDFFVFNPSSGQWFKLLNDGAAFPPQAMGAWWPGWNRYVLDLDADGISDVFLYDPASGIWFQCLSTPTGFTYRQGWWSPQFEIYPVSLNSDAATDLFLFNRTSGQWFWAVTQPNGQFTYPQSRAWDPNWQIYVADFNGDGISDLFLHMPSTGQWYVALTGAADFTYVFGVWTLGWTPFIADLDGNGTDDVFLFNRTSGQWTEMIGDRTGRFASAGSGFWSSGWDVYPTDLNGDSRADILLYNPTSGAWFQARNLTLGAFSYTNGFWDAGLTIVAD